MYTSIDGFCVRCTRIDGFQMPNVNNSYEQYSVWMQEWEVDESQCTWHSTRHIWTRCTRRQLMIITNPWCWPTGALRTWMETCAPAYNTSKCSNYGWMFMWLTRPHGIELVQYWESAKLHRFGTLGAVAELQGIILSAILMREKWEYPHALSPLEEYMDYYDILLCSNAQSKLQVK